MDDSKSGFAWGGVAFIVIFFLLIFGLFGFGKGRDGIGYGDGYAYGGGYGGGRKDCDCITDKDIYRQNCNDEKEELQDKIACLRSENQTLKTEKYVDYQTDKVMGAVGHVAHQVERLDCECLKRPPVWGEAVVACGREINERGCGCGRGRCGDRD